MQRRDMLSVVRDVDRHGGMGGTFDVSDDPASAADDDVVIDAVVVRPFESFDTFVVTHGKTLVRCAYLIVGDTGAAQDVVQIALVKVARRRPTVARP